MGEKCDRETHDKSGTDTKLKICNTASFPGSSCGSLPSGKVATMDAAAAPCIKKRDGLVRNDVVQSLKDPVRVDAECWSGQTLKEAGAGSLANKEVQSRSDTKA